MRPAPRAKGSFWGQTSLWGLSGGLWATAAFALTSVATVVAQHANWVPWAIFYGAVALLFVPAAAFSLLPSERRESVLRGETALCLILAFASLFALDPVLWVLLVPPTLMLAIAAGLIFGGGRSKEKPKG